MRLVGAPDLVKTTSCGWLDHEIATHRCLTCRGHTPRSDHPEIMGHNARTMLGLDGPDIPVRRIDNGHRGWFWTRENGPTPGRYPNEPVTGREWDCS